MKMFRSIGCATTVLCFTIGALFPAAAAGQAAQPGAETGKWQFSATVYGWVPTINGQVNFPGDRGSSDIHVSKSDVLNHLKMTFQGSIDAHSDRWGIFNDVVYVNVGGDKSERRDFSIGNVEIPASATVNQSLDIKALVWTVAGEYRVVSDPAWTVDLLGGARMLQMKPTLGYSITGELGPIVIPGRDGSKQVNEHIWDGIIGVKARYAFGNDGKWFAPLYLDVGTGQSRLTWQIAGGVGYTYNWGSVFATWRYLDYSFQSGKALDNINMNGPMLGVAFAW
jgi:hypothetical protein